MLALGDNNLLCSGDLLFWDVYIWLLKFGGLKFLRAVSISNCLQCSKLKMFQESDRYF